jgi:hypothetical protein
MKLSAMHVLLVEDLAFPIIMEADDEGGDKEEKKPEKSKQAGEGGGKKNEDSAAARAYHAAGFDKQQDLADRTRLSKATISKYKSSDPKVHINPSADALKRMAKAGVNPNEILKGVQ